VYIQLHAITAQHQGTVGPACWWSTKRQAVPCTLSVQYLALNTVPMHMMLLCTERRTKKNREGRELTLITGRARAFRTDGEALPVVVQMCSRQINLHSVPLCTQRKESKGKDGGKAPASHLFLRVNFEVREGKCPSFTL